MQCFQVKLAQELLLECGLNNNEDVQYMTSCLQAQQAVTIEPNNKYCHGY